MIVRQVDKFVLYLQNDDSHYNIETTALQTDNYRDKLWAVNITNSNTNSMSKLILKNKNEKTKVIRNGTVEMDTLVIYIDFPPNFMSEREKTDGGENKFPWRSSIMSVYSYLGK